MKKNGEYIAQSCHGYCTQALSIWYRGKIVCRIPSFTRVGVKDYGLSLAVEV